MTTQGVTSLQRVRLLNIVGLLSLCVGTTTVGILVWSSRSGLSPDSVTYLDMAQSLAAGKGLTHRWAYWDPVYTTGQLPTATTLWPPGLPLAIAVLTKMGVDPYFAGRLISLLSYGALPLPLFGLSRFLLPPTKALLCTGLVMMLFPVFVSSFAIATEPPFLFAATSSVLFTICAITVTSSRNAALYWLGASAAAGGAFLLRYVGLACAASTFIVAVVTVRRDSNKPQWVRLALAAGPAGIAITLVLLRNWLVAGTLDPTWPGADIFWSTLIPSMRAAIGALIGSKELLGRWLSLFLRPAELCLLIGLLMLAMLSFYQACVSARSNGTRIPGAIVTGILGLNILLYLALVMLAVGHKGMNIEERYLTVILPWCFVLLIGWALRAGSHEPSSAGRGRMASWAYLHCFFWIFCQSAVSICYVYAVPQEVNHIVAGKHSPTIAWIRTSVAANETILTNRGADIAYWTPNPVLRLPRLPHSAVRVTSWGDVDCVAMKLHAQYLVHFRGFPEELKYDREEFEFLRALDISENFPERKLISFDDAVVYRVGSSRTELHCLQK